MDNYVGTLESFIDLYEFEISLDSAMESDGLIRRDGPSASSKKLKAALNDYKEAEKENDLGKMSKAKAEINSVCREIDVGASSAKSADEKEKWQKAAKYGLAAMAIIAGAVTSVAAIKNSSSSTLGGVTKLAGNSPSSGAGKGNATNVVLNFASNNSGASSNSATSSIFGLAITILKGVLRK